MRNPAAPSHALPPDSPSEGPSARPAAVAAASTMALTSMIATACSGAQHELDGLVDGGDPLHLEGMGPARQVVPGHHRRLEPERRGLLEPRAERGHGADLARQTHLAHDDDV